MSSVTLCGESRYNLRRKPTAAPPGMRSPYIVTVWVTRARTELSPVLLETSSQVFYCGTGGWFRQSDDVEISSQMR